MCARGFGTIPWPLRSTDEFVTHWRHRHPEGRVIRRDLAAVQLAPLDAEWIGAAYTPPDQLTARRQPLRHARMNRSRTGSGSRCTISSFLARSNFGSTKWLAQSRRSLMRTGLRRACCTEKKPHFWWLPAGSTTPVHRRRPLNFIEPNLRTLFGFLGVGEMSFINAGGVARPRSGVTLGNDSAPCAGVNSFAIEGCLIRASGFNRSRRRARREQRKLPPRNDLPCYHKEEEHSQKALIFKHFHSAEGWGSGHFTHSHKTATGCAD